MIITLRDIAHDASTVRSIKEGLAMHGMDWDVELRKTFFYSSVDQQPREMPGAFAAVRSDTQECIGRVGSDYVPMRNSDALKHVDALLGTGIATLDSVFQFNNGARVGASLRLKEGISIAGEDPIELYIMVMTSHDGSQATRTVITPIRLWCSNQMALISRTARQSWSVRHLSTMSRNLDVVAKELELITNYAEWLERTGNELVEKKLDEYEFQQIAALSLDFIKDAEVKKKMTGEIVDVFKFSQLIGDDFRNSAWAGLNAITEYFDHHKPYRSPVARYNSITSGAGAKARNNATQLLMAR